MNIKPMHIRVKELEDKVVELEKRLEEAFKFQVGQATMSIKPDIDAITERVQADSINQTNEIKTIIETENAKLKEEIKSELRGELN